MSDTATKQAVVDRNYAAFRRMLPEILIAHHGKYALMRDENVVEYFDSPRDAVIVGAARFPDGLYSVQQVVETVADLGYFSHAVH
jgi:hypothetical protein